MHPHHGNERVTMNCHNCKSVLPDLLLDPMAASNAEARAHIETCAGCREELHSLEATFALLDSWQAPEPSAYFDQKMTVLLREEQANPPAGWFERLRSRILFNTGRSLRPAMAGALALVLVVTGGTIADISVTHHARTEASATINDLQILDNNEQAIQTMDELLQDDNSGDDGVTSPPTS
jgi:hypothetical protein